MAFSVFRALGSMLRILALLLALRAGAGCSNRVCENPREQVLALAPPRLSDTGLYADIAKDRIAANVLAYAPQFALWSDGAEKRRWIYLPEGSRIDTSDMDFWQFPKGTKLWKEFTRDGVRVETRLLFKYGPTASDWLAMAYAWTSDQSEAYPAPEGVIHARGTPHRVPAAGECFACHGGTPSRALGFSAIQLSYAADRGLLDLARAVERGMLTDTPPMALTVPGDSTERTALGYLHANCGHCHNQRRPTDAGLRCLDPDNPLDFWLRVEELGSVRSTRTYRTAIGFDVTPGAPDQSGLIDMVSKRPGMPPLATEKIDSDALALLREWIAEMRP